LPQGHDIEKESTRSRQGTASRGDGQPQTTEDDRPEEEEEERYQSGHDEEKEDRQGGV
jgi:hypothetical protein